MGRAERNPSEIEPQRRQGTKLNASSLQGAQRRGNPEISAPGTLDCFASRAMTNMELICAFASLRFDIGFDLMGFAGALSLLCFQT
jgi:hypothetical protein